MAFGVKTYDTKFHFFDFASPTIYHYLSIFFSFLFITLGLYFEDYSRFFIVWLLVFSVLTAFITHVLLNFSHENLKLIETGIVRMDEEKFIIDNEVEIYFKDVEYFNIGTFDYKGRRKYHRVSLEPNLSLGVNNSLTIRFNGKKISRKFQLLDKRQSWAMSTFISRLIVQDKFKNTPPREILWMVSNEVKKSEEGRKFIVGNIKSGQLSATEGLLMMGYNSDKEAKALRTKYSL